MSKLAHMFHAFGKIISDHSPQILTGMAVAGVVSTSVLAVKATPEALELIDQSKRKKLLDQDGGDIFDVPFSPLETFKAAWVCYIPATAVGSVTIASILLSTRIASKRNAALMSLWTLTETNFREYQEKVVEHIGKNKERAVQEAVTQDRVKNDPVSSKEVFLVGNGDQLCYDQLTGRYFMSTMEKLQKAEIAINQKIINEMYASQNDFYRMIDLPILDNGENVGWNTDMMLHLDFTGVLSDDDRPCMAVKYRFEPLHGYHHTF